MSTNLLEGLKLNHERIDWSDPAIDALSVTRELMGKQSHWNNPEFEGMEPMEIEREILLEAGIENWGYESVYGKPHYQHLLTLIRLLDPSTDITPTLADATMIFCLGLSMGKKLTNLIGSQNSSKSASSVRIGFAILYIDPLFSAVYVANPFDNAADSTIWGEIEDVWDNMCHHHPDPLGSDNPSFFPDAKKYANSRIEVVKDVAKAARIELRNIKHIGKYKGTKAKKDRTDNTLRGMILMLIDEVNEIDNMSFLGMLNNLSSQDNFHAITSQNFKDPEDMGGILTEPVSAFGGPSAFEELDVETDVVWHSYLASTTLRFDGLKAANVVAGRVIYPYLFKQVNLDHLKDTYGDQSPEWFSQCRSFPVHGMEANSVLSSAKLGSSRYNDKVFTIANIEGVVSFCDPSFGGRDKAVWGCAKYGTAHVMDGAGKQELINVLLFTRSFKSIKLRNEAHFDEYWFNRMRQVGIDISPFEVGALVSYEDQIALACVENNKNEGVPERGFGFDSSMRPDIVSSINRMMGFDVKAFDYNTKPKGCNLQGIKKNTEECCFNHLDELAFLTQDLFLCKQIRGGNFIETAVTQTRRTRYEIKNTKYKVEGKKEYKSRWQNVSPDHRDVLFGVVGMAHLNGFRANDTFNRMRGAGGGGYRKLTGSKKFKARKGVRI